MSGSVVPQEAWAVGIEAKLGQVAQARRNADGSSNHPTMFRVPSYIKALKPEAYKHQILSFGLYDRDFENTTRMDEVRLQVVSEFLEQMKAMPNSRVHSWEDLCLRVAGPVESAQQLRQLYDDGPGESLVSSKTARSVLTFDAVFLTFFLILMSEDAEEVQLPDFGRLSSSFLQKGVAYYSDQMYHDWWLFENQIPLFLVRQVWDHVYSDASDYRFNTQIRRVILPAVQTYLESLSPEHRISFTECDNLLHCLYTAVCHENPGASELQARRKPQILNPTNDSGDKMYRSMLPVTELHKAGIIVRGDQSSVSRIGLVKSTFFKATLNLPQIRITDDTERVLRNLSSFEMFHRMGEEHKLISYLAIMDDLINTEEDVRLLRTGKVPVIAANYLGDDQSIAALFNALGQNVLIMESQESLKLKQDVNDWCMQRNRQIFIRFVDRFLDRPWLLASLSAATLLLLMTALQTIFTIKGFYQPP